VFREYKPSALYDAVRQAVEAFQDADAWQALVARVMQQDWSWSRSAGAYAALYAEALEARTGRAPAYSR
jgi:starch synthase